MAAASKSLQNHGSTNHDVSRKELQEAIAKAVELRALHAALMQGNSPANLRFPSSSPVSRSVPYFSAQDYPVFTPVSFSIFNFFHWLITYFIHSRFSIASKGCIFFFKKNIFFVASLFSCYILPRTSCD